MRTNFKTAPLLWLLTTNVIVGSVAEQGIRGLQSPSCDGTVGEIKEAVANNETAIFLCPGEIEFKEGDVIEIEYYAEIGCQNPNPADQCVLKGDGSTSERFFWTKAGAKFKGLTFEGGNGCNGAAIRNSGGDPEVEGCAFLNNVMSCNYAGGAIHSFGTQNSVKVTNSTFTDNGAAGGQGGGICARGDLTVTGSTFTGNEARRGGAIFGEANLMLTDCTFVNNQVTKAGGAVHASSAAQAEGCTFTYNYAAEWGGAIFLDSNADLTIDGGRFEGNNATRLGSDVYGGPSNTVTCSTTDPPIFCDDVDIDVPGTVNNCGPATNCPS